MNFVYVGRVFVIYHEDVINVSEISEYIMLCDYLNDFNVFRILEVDF